jgi:hypothetical protein
MHMNRFRRKSLVQYSRQGIYIYPEPLREYIQGRTQPADPIIGRDQKSVMSPAL